MEGEPGSAALAKTLESDEPHHSGLGPDECVICLTEDLTGNAQVDNDDDGSVDLQSAKLREEDARAWRQLEKQRQDGDDVDVLIGRARHKYETRNRARAKKLEAQGWDYVERAMIMSPEMEWVDDDVGDEGVYDWERDEFELV